MVERTVSRWDYREIIPVVKKGGGGGGRGGRKEFMCGFPDFKQTCQLHKNVRPVTNGL